MAMAKFYWKDFDPAVCDPITLEPVCEFRCEPFQLGKAYFDCEMLAHYLISTATFVHPTTRERITREDCARLDLHIATHLSKQQQCSTKVIEAFDLLTNVGAKNKRESESMQREAAAIFQQLFVFRSRRSNTQQRRSTRRRGGGGFTVIDDDEDKIRFAQEERLAFDLQRDFPRLFPEQVRRQPITRKLAPAVPRGGGQIQHRVLVPSVVLVESPPLPQEEEEEEPAQPEQVEEEEDTTRIEAKIKKQLQYAARQQREEKAAAAALRTKQQQQPVIKRNVQPIQPPSPTIQAKQFPMYIFTASVFVLAIAIYFIT